MIVQQKHERCFLHGQQKRKISIDVKLAAIRLYEQGILELHQILNCIGFARHTFFRIKWFYDETGDVATLAIRHWNLGTGR